jgi:hypothetical protein
MSSALTRRALLGAVPAVCVAPSISLASAQVDASQSDPVVLLYRQWSAARKHWVSALDVNYEAGRMHDSPEVDEAYDQEYLIHSKLMKCLSDGPMTFDRMAIIATLLWDEVGPAALEDSESYQAQLESPVSLMIISLWQGATGRDGIPRVVDI